MCLCSYYTSSLLRNNFYIPTSSMALGMSMSVCLEVTWFCPDENILENPEWVCAKVMVSIRSPLLLAIPFPFLWHHPEAQMLRCNNFGDFSLSSILVITLYSHQPQLYFVFVLLYFLNISIYLTY